jgi:hypothetical protein
LEGKAGRALETGGDTVGVEQGLRAGGNKIGLGLYVGGVCEDGVGVGVIIGELFQPSTHIWAVERPRPTSIHIQYSYQSSVIRNKNALRYIHRLNMELDIQRCTHVETPLLSPSPRIWAHYEGAVGQPR